MLEHTFPSFCSISAKECIWPSFRVDYSASTNTHPCDSRSKSLDQNNNNKPAKNHRQLRQSKISEVEIECSCQREEKRFRAKSMTSCYCKAGSDHDASDCAEQQRSDQSEVRVPIPVRLRWPRARIHEGERQRWYNMIAFGERSNVYPLVKWRITVRPRDHKPSYKIFE